MFNISPTQIYAFKKAIDKMPPQERDEFLKKMNELAKEMQEILEKYGK